MSTQPKSDSVITDEPSLEITKSPSTPLVMAAIGVIQAIAEAIRELKRIPDGHLYAQVMSKIDLDSYNEIINTLVSSGVVERDGDVLVWKGKW